GINGVYTSAQKRVNSKDNYQSFEKDTIISGKSKSNPSLVKILVHSSTNAVEWLQNLGVNLDVLSKCGGHSFARTHKSAIKKGEPPINVGSRIIKQLAKAVNERKGQIELILKAKVVKIVVNDKLRSVIYEDEQQNRIHLNVDAIVLATGGFSADREGLLQEYGGKDLANLPTTNGPWTLGEGIKLAKELNAQ